MKAQKTYAKCRAFLLLLILAAEFLPAQEDYSVYDRFMWNNPERVKVKDSELSFSKDEYPHLKNDGLYFMSYFNRGWVFMINIFHMKSNLFDKWGIYALVSDPEGNSRWYTYEMDGRKIVFETDYLYITDGENTFSGREDVFKLDCNFDNFSCDLTFENVLPSWKGDDGYVYLDKEENLFEFRVVISPWAKVKGTINMNGEKIYINDGYGYGEKSLVINPITKLNPLLYAIRVYSTEDVPWKDRWHIHVLESVAHPEYNSKRIPRMIVARGGEWVFTTPDYTIEPFDYGSLEGIPYSYPKRVRIESEANDYKLSGVYTSRVFFDYTDVFAEIPPILRAIIKLFFNRPVYFRNLGDFKGTLTKPDGEVVDLNLTGPYEYIVVK